jgi:hypothetical protein
MRRRALSVVVFAAWSITVAVAAAPEAPRNLTAIVSGNTVTFTWQAPSTGSVPLVYFVEAAQSPGGVVIAALATFDTAVVVGGVPNGVYYVRVRGVNTDGLGAASNEVVVSVPSNGGGCTSAPAAPRNLSATVVGSLVTLNWQAPLGGCPPTGYIVHAGSVSNASDLAVINVGATTTLSVSAPPGGYFVRVLAVNAYGASAASNEVRVIVPSTVPSNVTGLWHGTSTYINAPFDMNLVQTGTHVSGSYQDQKDFGGAAGTVTGSHILIDVNFGDTGIRFEGTIESANRITGTIFVPLLSARYFPFEMTRQ